MVFITHIDDVRIEILFGLKYLVWLKYFLEVTLCPTSEGCHLSLFQTWTLEDPE